MSESERRKRIFFVRPAIFLFVLKIKSSIYFLDDEPSQQSNPTLIEASISTLADFFQSFLDHVVQLLKLHPVFRLFEKNPFVRLG